MNIRKYLKAVLATLAMAVVPVLFAESAKAGEVATGLATDGTLVSLPVDSPGTATVSTVTFPMTATDTDLVGLDYRPRGGGLYAVAEEGTFYVLNPGAMAGTFSATQINQTPLISPYSFDKIGFDFNPAPDAIRLVTDDQGDFRFSPNNGALLGTDGALTYAPGDVNAGDTPTVVGAGYTNSKDGTAGTATTLFEIDSAQDTFVTQGSVNATPTSPNTGQLFTVGALGVDTTENAGLDIAPASGTAYAALELAGSTGSSTIYRVNLATGAPESIGQIGGGKVLESLAVLPASVIGFASSAVSVDERAGSTQVVVTRTGGLNREVTVNYTATGEGAPPNGTVTFPVNVARQVIEVPVTDNPATGADRTINLQLDAPGANAIVGELASTAVTVIDVPRQAAGSPVALISVLTNRINEIAGKGRIRTSFSCDKACGAKFTVRFGGRQVGTATSTLATSGKRSVTVKLGANGRKLVKRKTARKRSAQFSITGRFTSPGETATTQTLRFLAVR